jgi:hypothetical protein
MGDRWVDLITLMLANPPDPTEKLPLSNQRNTIWGTTLTFLVTVASAGVLSLNIDDVSRSLLL